jgi:putative ABC transport system permease protein
MLADLRYSLRALWKRPSFTAGTVLVLALAVGVNTAVFSLIDALLLQPLPVPDSRDLAFIYHSDDRRGSVTYDAYEQVVRKVAVFSAIAARSSDSARLRAGVDPIPLQGEAVTPNYFDVLGVTPRIGRAFDAGEASPAANPVAIISEGLWKSQFAGDPAIVGRILRIDAGEVFVERYTASRDYTIVGVMPASFTGIGNPWQPAQYWVLLAQRVEDHRAATGHFRNQLRLGDWPVLPIGRLSPGVGIERARAVVDAAAREILAASPEPARPQDTFLVVSSRRVRLPFAGTYFMNVPRILATLAAVGTILLIIAGANLAGMLLARGVSRRNEIAVRLSLGIPRRRLVRQLVIESALLAIAAGAAALVLARVPTAAALHGLPSQIAGGSGTALLIEVPLNVHAIVFAFGSGLLTAIAVGLAPALQAMRVDLLAALAGGAAVSGASRSRLRRIVLVPQIALSLVLLLVTGVFVRALLRLELAAPGYDAERVLTLSVQFPYRPIETNEQAQTEAAMRREVQARILDRLSRLPGAIAAALADYPFDGVPLPVMGTKIIARSDYETTRQYRGVTYGFASADYFRTLGIPLLRGRAFDARERDGGSKTVIVTQRLADELWPRGDPIGQQIAVHSPDSRYPIQWRDVVGVVASVTRPLDEYPRPVYYVPVESQPLMATTFLVKGSGNPAELAAAAKQAIASVDSSLIVAQARPLEETLSGVRYPRRFTAGIVGASGTAALLLAAIGVFALMSYAVAQRVGEIGVRMVLGAARQDIVRLILKDGAAVAIAGIAIGFALAFGAIRYVSHAIVPLPELDAATFVTVPLLLAGVVLLACYLPARRASRVDPLVVLRKV